MKYYRNTEIVWRFIDEHYYLLQPATSEFCKLNTTASLIWDCLETPRNAEEIIDFVINITDLDQNDHIKKDVHIFLNKMKKDRFIVEKDI